MSGHGWILKGNLVRRIRRLSPLAAAAVMLVDAGPAAAEPDWINKRQHDFPAKVASMTFANGNVMNQSNAICWSKWCVKIDPDTTVAYYKCFSEQGLCPQITIKGLVCENSGIGRVKDCSFSFTYKATGNYKTCGLLAGFYLNPALAIECPEKIKFR